MKASPWENNDLAAGAYTFAIVAMDSSGNQSANPGFTTALLGDPRRGSALLERSFRALGWPGEIENGFVSNKIIYAESNGAINDLPNTINELPDSISAILPNKSPVSYTTSVMDLGADLSFTPLVSIVANGEQEIKMKTGSGLDGGVTGDFVPVNRILARYIQLKIAISGADPVIYQVTAVMDGQVKIDEFNAIDTANQDSNDWFQKIGVGHFRLASNSQKIGYIVIARIEAIQSATTSLTWTLVTKNTTIGQIPAAEFKISDASGQLTDAIIDATLKGPKL
uniref:Uncharacterized protein n=1 Tax=Candidatus Kentrum sp. UNK TaxID=2126344 RepID=A0A450ZWI1_9GAMM|nr:MAG: hypothetical protein BECKUNK1418G_GA0071005_100227 [Candidatus Kentron sp. UNK]VFK68268.1 MAG: hypothetical protein BECKUNK1418H_GA0071006_100127 [Candidatus Kentron sp. UNK]